MPEYELEYIFMDSQKIEREGVTSPSGAFNSFHASNSTPNTKTNELHFDYSWK